MKTLFVGDVHGCAATLRALLEEAHADRVILLGDLFAKGPDPGGVWALIQDYRAESVMGNHDARLLECWDRPGSSKSGHYETARKLNDECRNWLAERPIFLHGAEWTAVHAGVHPELGWEHTTERQAMILRRWPDETPSNPYWWRIYTCERRIFYGHDAMRGLRLRGVTMGLDTACTYGHQLSGYILEEERLLQIPYRENAPPWPT